MSVMAPPLPTSTLLGLMSECTIAREWYSDCTRRATATRSANTACVQVHCASMTIIRTLYSDSS
jgi:hypothetical protein